MDAQPACKQEAPTIAHGKGTPPKALRDVDWTAAVQPLRRELDAGDMLVPARDKAKAMATQHSNIRRFGGNEIVRGHARQRVRRMPPSTMVGRSISGEDNTHALPLARTETYEHRAVSASHAVFLLLEIHHHAPTQYITSRCRRNARSQPM
mmetsp:Transcript_5337/g.15701  ORF Transcript_5337/g.15701 Transcript_5337/m.15701 type:complete len:151 (+) Transcript_5337:185-637(+)